MHGPGDSLHVCVRKNMCAPMCICVRDTALILVPACTGRGWSSCWHKTQARCLVAPGGRQPSVPPQVRLARIIEENKGKLNSTNEENINGPCFEMLFISHFPQNSQIHDGS